MMTIDQYTDLYGIVGFPLGHSLSPGMHNTAFRAVGLNAVYLAFETREINDCLRGMRALGIKGLSVTLPHKSAVIPLLDKVEDRAKRIGAVNTIVNSNGRLKGYNTDAVGALRSLQGVVDLPKRRCLIVGAGGAARAIAFMLKELDCELIIANRSKERGEELAASLGCPFVPLDEIKDIKTDLIIQTTSVGMHPDIDQCPVPENLLRKGTTVMDIIYNPLETKLLKLAKKNGCRTISGLGMFIYQGAEQFRLWTGLEAPVEVMTRAVKRALKNTL